MQPLAKLTLYQQLEALPEGLTGGILGGQPPFAAVTLDLEGLWL
jgi:hypothetical protein